MLDANQAPCGQVTCTDIPFKAIFRFWSVSEHFRGVFSLMASRCCFKSINKLLILFLPPVRDLPPESPHSWILQHSSGSGSANTVEEMVMTVGDTEVKLRKCKKKKKRSSMIFITEERERTSTLDCKRVRFADEVTGEDEGR